MVEQEVEPRLLQFMAENPLGRTCLPIRFQRQMNEIPEESILEGGRDEDGLGLSSIVVQHPDPSTPGLVVLLDTPRVEETPMVHQIPRTPVASKVPQLSTMTTDFIPKSPGVKQLISLFSRHQTAASNAPSHLEKTPQSSVRQRSSKVAVLPPTPLNVFRKLILDPSEVEPPQMSIGKEDMIRSYFRPSPDHAVGPSCQGTPCGRGRLPVPEAAAFPMTQAKEDPMSADAAVTVSVPASEGGSAIEVSSDHGSECKDEDPRNSGNPTKFSLEYSNRREEESSIERPTPDFVSNGDQHPRLADLVERYQLDDDDVPVPADQRKRDDAQGEESAKIVANGNYSASVTGLHMDTNRNDTNIKKRRGSGDNEEEVDESDIDHATRNGNGAGEKYEESESDTMSADSSIELKRQRFLSVDPNATHEALKHQQELGIDVIRRRGAPKDLEILVHPGQQKRQKAKDINWDSGIVQPVKFRGDENRVLTWQKHIEPRLDG